MKLKYKLAFTNFGDKTAAVPMETNNADGVILQCNDSAAYLLRLLENDTTEDALVAALAKEYANEEEQLREMVRHFTEMLLAKQLLEL